MAWRRRQRIASLNISGGGSLAKGINVRA